jgi:N,N'-diacetyllegionaminate synthase
MELWKIPSGEITNLPLLRRIGSLGRRVIVSSGMANLGEIEDCINALTESGTRRDDITILHCNTEYPTPYEDVNLRAMAAIRSAFDIEVGYSDHTPGIEIPIAAAALGARVIEKHFTLDRNMRGPDHHASIEPAQLKAMVDAVRNIEVSLGDGIKRPSPSEAKNRRFVRKSIVASRDIAVGETLNDGNITTKRAGRGMSPMEWDSVLGRESRRSYRKDEPIEW